MLKDSYSSLYTLDLKNNFRVGYMGNYQELIQLNSTSYDNKMEIVAQSSYTSRKITLVIAKWVVRQHKVMAKMSSNTSAKADNKMSNSKKTY